jgi:hypothetical protein
MIQNFRGKKTKDIETASDTIMHNAELVATHRNSEHLGNNISTNLQQLNMTSFDTFIEKKNKKF